MTLLPKLKGKLLKILCLLQARLRGGTIRGLSHVSVSVPLIADGQGEVRLEPRSSFGYREAPIYGNGHIRLQARPAGAKIHIGSGCAFSNNITLCALNSIIIGDYCLIGDMVSIFDADHHELNPAQRWSGQGRIAPVVIGNNVWIGSRAMILRGVTIGNHSVVGAGAVVTRSVPSRTVVAGNPAKVVRVLPEES